LAYTEVGVVNLALQRLGAAVISALDEGTNNADAANNVWEYVRNEVLEARDWHFARSRTTLDFVPPRVDLRCNDGKHLYVQADRWIEDILDISIEILSNTSDALSVAVDSSDTCNIQIKLANSTDTENTAALIQTALRAIGTVNGVSVAAWTVTANAEWTASPATADVDLNKVDMAAAPSGTYGYAYLLPSDFLRPVVNQPVDKAIDPTGAVSMIFLENTLVSALGDIPYPYVIETYPDDTKILCTDYEATESYPLELVYIRKVTDVTKWTAHFIMALSFRLAAELSFIIPESAGKFDRMIDLYEIWLRRASALDRLGDFVKYETGSDTIEMAGRK